MHTHLHALAERPACVGATADTHEVRDVVEGVIRECRHCSVTLLLDAEHDWEERILSERFVS